MHSTALHLKAPTQSTTGTYDLLQFQSGPLRNQNRCTSSLFLLKPCTAPTPRHGTFSDPDGLPSPGMERFDQGNPTQLIENSYSLLLFENDIVPIETQHLPPWPRTNPALTHTRAMVPFQTLTGHPSPGNELSDQGTSYPIDRQ